MIYSQIIIFLGLIHVHVAQFLMVIFMVINYDKDSKSDDNKNKDDL